MLKNLKHKFIFILCFLFVIAIFFFASDKFIAGVINDYFITQDVSEKNIKPSEDIVMVVIDKKSIEQIRWPWQRVYYGEIIDFLENMGEAKVVAFDIVIDRDDLFYPESDKKFYDILKKSQKTIGVFDILKPNSTKYLESTNETKDFSKLFKTKIDDSRHEIVLHNKDYRVRFPEGFFRNIKDMGATGVISAKDGMIRNFNPVVHFNDAIYPSIALSVYSQYKGIYDFYLTENYVCSKVDNCKSLKIPIKNSPKIGIYSSLKWQHSTKDAYAYKYYSAVDIVNSYEAIKRGEKPLINPKEFKNKIVLVGGNVTLFGQNELKKSPYNKDELNVDIQANIINNLLDNNFLTEQPDWQLVLITFLMMFAVYFVSINFTYAIGVFFAGVISVTYFIIYTSLLSDGFLINPLFPLFSILVLIFFLHLHHRYLKKLQEIEMQNALKKYVPKDMIKGIFKSGTDVKLGGKKAVVTVMFVDIRNFTTISEELGAEKVMVILNEYFSALEEIVHQNKGVVNKFIGDAIMAVFGDPINDSKHAYNSIVCGNMILQKMKELKAKWIEEGYPKIDVGIGVNTGEAFVGNIGTENRFEYTVIGDVVNTASRIEGYNKLYKSKFLIGEETYKNIIGQVDVIKIREVEIRGKTQKINIYEVLRIIEE